MNESGEQDLRGEDGRHGPAPDGTPAAGTGRGQDSGALRADTPRAGREPGRSAGRGRGRRLPAGVAERLLNGEDVAGGDPRAAELAGLLDAARVLPPGRPQDEAAALDAFRRAAAKVPAATSAVPVPAVRRRWPAAGGSRSARMLVGGAVAVFTLSGVAIAAQGGGLPHPFHSSGGATHDPSPSDSAPSASGTGTAPGTPGSPSGTGTPPAHPGTPHGPGSATHVPGGPVDAGTKGLCEGYVKAAREGKQPTGESQARLAKAAGGASRIDAYCTALLASAAPGHGQKSAEPHAGATPTDLPTPTAPPASPQTSANPKATVPATPNAVRHK